MNIEKNFSVRVAELRKTRKLNQTQLGLAIGLSQDSISDIERSRTTTSFANLVAFARFFNVSTDYLLGLTDDPTPPPPAKGGDVVVEP
jgi:transcriptional regulator with XRE-family HTH domain